MIQLEFKLNGDSVSAWVSPQARLLDVVRDSLGFTGTLEGCGAGECGSCTLLVDGAAINACLFPALEARGCEITTIEGLAAGTTELGAIQRSFLDHHGAQCGFCTPGMIMSAVALLNRNPDPSDQEICDALTGNLCRCTGYHQIIQSIREAAALIRKEATA